MNRTLPVLLITAGLTAASSGAGVSKDTLKSSSTPNRVETRIGALEFKGGAPTDGYDGQLPEGGFYVAHSRTNRVLILGRSFMQDNDPAPAVEQIKSATRIYPYQVAECSEQGTTRPTSWPTSPRRRTC